MSINKEDDRIPAGREFVYGVCRSNIKYAVQSFDHDLIVSVDDKELIMQYVTICRLNDINMDEDENTEDKTALIKRKPNLDIDLILEVDDIITLTNGNGSTVFDDEKKRNNSEIYR